MIPEVSVVIRNFNRCERLARPIDSVLAQTFDAYEIIFVDDASTDGAVGWVRERYGHLDQLTIVERAKNGGTGAAANTGVGAATANFVAFLDSDDSYLPDHFEMHLRALRAAPSSIGTYCDFFQVWADYGIERLVRSRTVEDQRR